jgi:hypothetical protein
VPRPFEGPIHIEPSDPTAGAKTPGTHCTCPGFCQGRTSADWATCSSTCKHCNPRTRQRRPIISPDPSSAEVDHGQ